jgi:hypothetical protein
MLFCLGEEEEAEGEEVEWVEDEKGFLLKRNEREQTQTRRGRGPDLKLLVRSMGRF